MKHLPALLLILLLLAPAPAPVRADEGMWLFENLPVERIRRSTGVRLTDEWLEHVRKASLRFEVGGSGSFVGPNGLAITNHHIVDGSLARLSTPERDVLTHGYLARTPEEELRLPDFAVRALWSIEDVTERVKDAGEGMEAAPAEAARRAEIATIESEAHDATGLECEVVTLYNGGLYHLYRYKQWTDVRLVWAPDEQIANFGGDTDNFRYPRFCLDSAIVRVYDDEGNPVRPQHFLEFTEDGLEDADPCFVSGHPGSTRRLLSVDHLAFLRDRVWPVQLAYTFRREVELERFADEHPEHAALILRDLPGIQNWRKALDDRLRALQTPSVFEKKKALEGVFRARIAGDPEIGDRTQRAYEDVARAQEAYAPIVERLFVLEREALNWSDLFDIARRIVRRAAELEKPSGERLPEFTDARLAELERRIMTESPVAPALERHRVETWLGLFAETWGADAPLVRGVLGERSAREAATDLVEGTRLGERDVRRALMRMSADELAEVNDPMIVLARTLEPESRRLLGVMRDDVEAVETIAYDTIAGARFLVFGTNDYPDATFTLRLSSGRVGGYTDGDTVVPPFTTFAGLWARWRERQGREPFDLPERWIGAMDALPADTPFNFVTDHHIIGGNSGSPVVDTRARFVGVIFDGNEQSASWGSVYDNERGRSVSVDARAIATALRTVYDAEFLVDQLNGE